MTGQGARDDEREVLIENAGSFRQIAGDYDPNSMIGVWLRTASELEAAVAELAEARKHPAPEFADGSPCLTAAELIALIHRQSGTSAPAPLWCPPSPTRDDDTYIPDGGGGCSRCGHDVDEHEMRD